MPFTVTKTFGHERGLSACFRQWRAPSHCHLLHGYALAVTFTIVAETLDERNWVFDFGRFGQIKDFLSNYFDHKLLVAADDPGLAELCALNSSGFAEVLVLDDVGCEAFARFIYNNTAKHFADASRGCYLQSVEVREHGSNAASYTTPFPSYSADA